MMLSRSSIALVLAALGLVNANPIAAADETQIAATGEATVNPVGNGAKGSCGTSLNNGQLFVALSNSFMQNKSPSPYCGRKIKVTNTGPHGDNSIGGKGNSVTVVVRDTCPGCSQGHLDLSVAAWNKLTNNAAHSVVGIKWEFV